MTHAKCNDLEIHSKSLEKDDVTGHKSLSVTGL